MATLKPDFNNTFVNPYNFISKTSKVQREEYKQGNLTGYISCKLMVKDALLLPDRNSETKPDTFDFYKINGIPTIPGSEIRGGVRSVYEAVTPSCFSVINSEILHQRLSRPDTNIKAGVLKNKDGEWRIFEAEKCKKGDNPDITREWMSFKKRKVVCSYYKIVSKSGILCQNAQINNLLFILNEYLNNVTDNDFISVINETKENINKGQSIVVFFDYDSDIKQFYYLSVAQISRRVFENTVPLMLEEHRTCSGSEYCPACSLFGTLGNNAPIASKIRFSDASADCNSVKIGNVRIIPELSTPRITSLEFYSKVGDGNRNIEKWTYDDEGVELRGRKFYFHSKPKIAHKLNGRNIATPAAEEGSTFIFNVYFDRINEKQLKELLWVLTIGDNTPNSMLMHKIGSGRPVGYGSVNITVEDIVLRNFDGQGYNIESKKFTDYDINDSIFSEKDALAQFKKIADYNFVINKNVRYPIANDGGDNLNSQASHRWFSSNRLQNGVFQFTLPELKANSTADDLELPAMVNGDFNNSSQSSGDKKSTFNQNKFDMRPTINCSRCGCSFKSNYKGPSPLCQNCKGKQ